MFTNDLVVIIEDAVRADQDIIPTEDFNKTIKEDHMMMTRMLTEGRLTNLHANRHGNNKTLPLAFRVNEGWTTISYHQDCWTMLSDVVLKLSMH